MNGLKLMCNKLKASSSDELALLLPRARYNSGRLFLYLCKNKILMVDGDYNIDCKIDGFGAMKLKSEFVKKV
ncbi:hypothetical protein SAMN02745207_03998 [Clostridium grantii DSM 8605]|uniref:Protein YjdM C-terminal domain-containing protein n=1 Tax=Clostridium grantii DSM 8605 TaxID=1121316 RepID=A0A1M5XWJ4_9CLOT|nr:hypothetical protein SAMN02745207_03998 [Clostridium grantii DSM 8605]